jgi:NifU-like protein
MAQETTNQYGVKVSMFIDDPKYMGTISQEELDEKESTLFTYTYGDESVDYKLTFHWAVDKDDDHLVTIARYTYEGIPSGIAVNHMVSLLFTNKTMTEIDTINFQGLEKLLRDNPQIPALPAEENYAITFAVDAAKLAVKAYKNESLSDEAMSFPCKDTVMSLASIKENIRAFNIETLEEVAAYTKAGLSDTGCHNRLLELIEENKLYVEEQAKVDQAISGVPFEEMSPEHRVIAVDTAVEHSVRQFLVMDGGDIDILSVKENGDMFEVYISYLGACSSCDSSGTGTLFAIENALKEKLHPNIRVIPI